MAKDRKLTLEESLKALEKKHGDGVIIRGMKGNIIPCEAISTGSLTLDVSLGIGGLPKGRITEIYGPEGGGKTTLALHAVANAQKQGGKALFIDVEHSLDPIYASNIGVDMDNLLISQPEWGEQIFDMVENVLPSGEVSIVVIDSVAAIVPKDHLEADYEDKYYGGIGNLMSKGLRKIVPAIKRSGAIVIFINQLRDKMGGMAYGSNDKTTGGRSLPYYASIRLDIRRIGSVKSGDDAIGNIVKVKIAKNKVAPPFRVATFDIIFGKGISNGGCLLDLGVNHGIIDKSGNFYYADIDGSRECLGNGRNQAVDYFDNNPEFASNIEDTLRETFMPKILAKKDDEEHEVTEDEEI